MDNKKKENPYILCEAKDDSHVIVNMNGNEKVLFAMACTIIFDLAHVIGVDLEKFAYALATATVHVAETLKEKKEEEKPDENPVF